MSMFIEFPPVSAEEWEAAARADLKGRPLGKIMYRAEDVDRAGQEASPIRAWRIWAEVADIDTARRALGRGAEGLVVNCDLSAEWASLANTVPCVAASKLSVVADELTIPQQIAAVHEEASGDWIVPVGPLYFEEIAKFRALRRLHPAIRIIARTSHFHATAYDPHVNLLRGTTGAMAAIIGGCDAVIVAPFTAACGYSEEHAERLALNTQLLLRDEASFGRVADPAAGSWYIETLTLQLMQGTREVPGTGAFIGVNRYPNTQENSPAGITAGRAMTALEQCRLRSGKAAGRPTVRLVCGADEKMSRARAAFSRDFFAAGGFAVVDGGDADVTVLCDADANYPSAREFPVLAAGLDFGRRSNHAALIAEWQNRLGI